MKRLSVTDQLVESLITEVAPLVEETTGWRLELSGVRSRVLPRDRGYEEILLGRIRGAGVEIDDGGSFGLIGRLTEYFVESNILAAYESSRQEILVVRENVDDSNMDGLRLVIIHELVHRAQHVRHPEMFTRIDREIREVFEMIIQPGGIKRALEKMKEMQPVMTLIESHAQYVQETLHRTRFPDAKVESHFNLPALILRRLGAKKISQYTDGIPAVTEAIAHGSMDALYSQTKNTK